MTLNLIAEITTGLGILIGCALLSLVILYAVTMNRWNWSAPLNWLSRSPRMFRHLKSIRLPRFSLLKSRRALVILGSIALIGAITGFLIYKQVSVPSVARSELTKGGKDGDELWFWISDDQRGPYTGWVWEKESSHWDISTKYFVRNGKRNGRCTTWHENGTKASEGDYRNNLREGKWTLWYQSGQRRAEFTYREGLIHEVVAWKPNGTSCPITNVKDGDGTIAFYYRNGQMEQKVELQDGVRHGIESFWHENGQLAQEVNYQSGLREGPWSAWHDNGERREEGQYTSGKREGSWSTFYPSGSKDQEAAFSDDKLDGKWAAWHENGKKSQEGYYRSGEKHGEWKTWDKRGRVIETQHFENGELAGEGPEWRLD